MVNIWLVTFLILLLDANFTLNWLIKSTNEFVDSGSKLSNQVMAVLFKLVGNILHITASFFSCERVTRDMVCR